MDVFTLQALRRGKAFVHREIAAGSVISLDKDEATRAGAAVRVASKDEVALAKSRDTYFDGGAKLNVVDRAAAQSTSTPAATQTDDDGQKVKPFDKMTKAELDAALKDSGLEAPENWSSLKNFDKATWLTEATAKQSEGSNDANDTTNDDDLTV